jgi:hypothetical protein
MTTSLYDHAGGGPALLALADAHHTRCLADPLLEHPFSHTTNHPEHVRWAVDQFTVPGVERPATDGVPRWTWDGLAAG